MLEDENIKTFNKDSDRYKYSRPDYPAELYEFLSEICPGNKSVWDCACGNGQAAKSLVKYFNNIKASDINDNQIENAFKHDRIEYSIQNSENTFYDSNSFDLVCVAQALHWFSSDTFFKEVHRVLRAGGIFACWGYSFFKISPKIDEIIEDLILKPLYPYWSERNKSLWNNYSDISFPFQPIAAPEIVMSQEWSRAELMAYIKTWSAYKRYIEDANSDFANDFSNEISLYWDRKEKKTVKMDFIFYCGRNQ